MAADVIVYWTHQQCWRLSSPRSTVGRLSFGRDPGIHFLSTLGWAEVAATLARVAREKRLGSNLAEATQQSLRRFLRRAQRADRTGFRLNG